MWQTILIPIISHRFVRESYFDCCVALWKTQIFNRSVAIRCSWKYLPKKFPNQVAELTRVLLYYFQYSHRDIISCSGLILGHKQLASAELLLPCVLPVNRLQKSSSTSVVATSGQLYLCPLTVGYGYLFL